MPLCEPILVLFFPEEYSTLCELISSVFTLRMFTFMWVHHIDSFQKNILFLVSFSWIYTWRLIPSAQVHYSYIFQPKNIYLCERNFHDFYSEEYTPHYEYSLVSHVRVPFNIIFQLKNIYLCTSPFKDLVFTWRIYTPMRVHFNDIFQLNNIHLCVSS